MGKKKNKPKTDADKQVQLPPFIRVGYQDFVVTRSKDATHTDRAHGYTRKDDAHIHINIHSNKVNNANTLLHEVLHAVVYTQGMDLSDDMEETVVNALSNGLTQVIRDNPQFIHYILDQLEMI